MWWSVVLEGELGTSHPPNLSDMSLPQPETHPKKILIVNFDSLEGPQHCGRQVGVAGLEFR